MSATRHPLDILNVPSPCRVRWRSMSGTDRVRFCPDCRQNVYNLSALTAAEAGALLRGVPDGPCVRFSRGAGGAVATADRRGGRLARARARVVAAVIGAFVGLAALAGCDCSRFGMCTQGKVVAPPPAPPPAPEDDGP